MHLVLADSGDACAQWLAEGLRGQGLDIRLANPWDLLDAPLSHHVGKGGAWFTSKSWDGPLDSRATQGYVNRCPAAGPGLGAMAVASDRMYALQERHAVLLSLMEALPGPAFNPPTPSSLTGAVDIRAAEAHDAAAQRGPAEAGCDAVVIGDAVVGRLSREARDECLALAKSHGLRLMGARLQPSGRGATIAWATATPDLRALGQPALETLATALRGPP